MTNPISIKAGIRACPEHAHLDAAETDALAEQIRQQIEQRKAAGLRRLPKTVWPNGRTPR